MLRDEPLSLSVAEVPPLPEFYFIFVKVPSSTLLMNFVLIGISGYSCKTSSFENRSPLAACFVIFCYGISPEAKFMG